MKSKTFFITVIFLFFILSISCNDLTRFSAGYMGLTSEEIEGIVGTRDPGGDSGGVPDEVPDEDPGEVPDEDPGEVPGGLTGGHFDLDTSSQVYPFDAGHTNKHIHAYDDMFGLTYADFFNLQDDGFK